MTLTETAKFTKRFLIFTALFSAALLVVWLGSVYYKNYLYSKVPQIEDKPDLKFALLPKLKFSSNSISSSNYSYSLDTPTGALPEKLPTSFKIYAVPQLGNTFLASDKARGIANSFNFNNGPEILSPTVHKFSDDKGGKFTIDINSGNFDFQKSAATPSAQSPGALNDQPQLVQQIKSFLLGKNLLPDQIAKGRATVNYLDNTQPGESRAALLSLWQEDIGGYKIVTDKFYTGLINATVTSSADQLENYLSLDYTYWPIDLEVFATYPIKSAEEAFTQLKSGNGIIIKEPKSPQASIGSVYLAYFLSKEYPEYLQPVYVFEGEGFVAFVQAVKDTYQQSQ